MRRTPMIVVAAGAALVASLAFGLRPGRIPLGVPGEWEWIRIARGPSTVEILIGLAGIVAFSTFAAVGFRALGAAGGPRREVAWLAGLVAASVAAQGLMQAAAPEAFGLSKWIFVLHDHGSSGYYTVARAEMADTRRFLADYPAWIARQDALHIGTHPPGLFLVARWAIDAMAAHPVAARWILEVCPPIVGASARVYRDAFDLSRTDAASLALTGALTLVLCASTVVPLYALARSGLTAPAAWASATLWPMVPSALMFQPTADTAFPFLSTTALALACWSGRVGAARGLFFCAGSGLVMAVGMAFTLAFLPVGLVVAMVLLTGPGVGRGHRASLVLATGLGFLAGTLAWWASTSANPFATWWINQRNHARFYREYPRTHLAWAVENPIELAVGLGLPAAAWAAVGLFPSRRGPRVAWSTLLVLAVLTLTGKNLSEVARLWLPLMPPLLVAAGSGLARSGGGAWTLAGSIALVGLQALLLEATIQVVFPF